MGIVGAGQLQAAFDGPLGRVQAEAETAGYRLEPGLDRRWLAEAEIEAAAVAGQGAPDVRAVVIGRKYGNTMGGQCRDGRAVLVGGGLDRAHEFLMLALGVVDQGDGRLGDAGQVGDLAGMIHAQLDDGVAMLGAQAEQRQRQADVVVEIAPCRQSAVLARRRGQDGGQHLGDGGLAVAAGDGDHRNVEASPPTGRRRTQRQAGVGNQDLRHVEVQPTIHHQRHGPAGQGLVGEVMGVEPLALQAEEQAERRQVAGIGADILENDGGIADQLGVGNQVGEFAQGHHDVVSDN